MMGFESEMKMHRLTGKTVMQVIRRGYQTSFYPETVRVQLKAALLSHLHTFVKVKAKVFPKMMTMIGLSLSGSHSAPAKAASLEHQKEQEMNHGMNHQLQVLLGCVDVDS